MTVCASNFSVPSRSSAAMSSHPSTGGCGPVYQGKGTRPSVTPVVMNTVARNPWRSRIGSASSRTSAKPSSNVRPTARSGRSPVWSSESASISPSAR